MADNEAELDHERIKNKQTDLYLKKKFNNNNTKKSKKNSPLVNREPIVAIDKEHHHHQPSTQSISKKAIKHPKTPQLINSKNETLFTRSIPLTHPVLLATSSYAQTIEIDPHSLTINSDSDIQDKFHSINEPLKMDVKRSGTFSLDRLIDTFPLSNNLKIFPSNPLKKSTKLPEFEAYPTNQHHISDESISDSNNVVLHPKLLPRGKFVLTNFIID